MPLIENSASLTFAFLDSGTGGLPYMFYLKKHYPSSLCVYLADAKNFPYGTKTPEEVVKCSSECINLILQKWNPNVIIIACNTISVTALDSLRKQYPDVPIVGTVPAIKLAAEISKNRTIGLLATEGTVKHPYVKNLQDKFARDCKIVPRADTQLVSFVEHKFFTSTEQERLEAIKPAFDFFTQNNCDAIILGCTHYVHLAQDFQKLGASHPFKVNIIDSREGVVRHAIKAAESHVQNDDILSLTLSFLQDKPIDQSLYVTGFNNVNDENVYKNLCKKQNIHWGGSLL